MSTTSISVVPYNPQWPQIFIEESQKIQNALGKNCLNIHHIGSTSVPGLAAKPIIDMIPVVSNIVKVEQAIELMKALGYEYQGEYGLAFRRFFQKRSVEGSFNVHIFEQDNTEIDRHINFRDWMKSHQEDKLAYQNLKLQLAAQYPDDLYHYCISKTNFVSNIDQKCGFDGYRLVITLTDEEWTYYKKLHDEARLKTHVQQSTFEPNKQHYPFVLYQRHEMIGVAHIEFMDNHQAKLYSLLPQTDKDLKDNILHQLLSQWIAQFGLHWAT